MMIKIEQDGLDIDYTDKLREYNNRKRTLEQNLLKVSKLIMSHCNKIMQSRLKAISDYESRLRDDLKELLEEINNKMYDPSEDKYDYDMVTRVFRHLFNTT